MEKQIRSAAPNILILLTLGTLFFGVSFYYNQLAATPVYLWLFVPDCPLYAVMASIILLSGWPKSPALRFVIACACALYGSWTIFVFGAYSEFYLSPLQLPVTLALIIGHLGMVLQALLLLPKRKELGYAALGLAMAWLLLNTFADYRMGSLSTHPWIGGEIKPVVEQFTWVESVLWPLLLFALADLAAKNMVLEKIRKMVRWN